MEYYVHAVARTHSFYDDIVVKLPIVIVGDKVTRCTAIDLHLLSCAMNYPGSRRE